MPSHDHRIHNDIVKLDCLTRSELVSQWTSVYGMRPFKGARNLTLIRGLAYQSQSKSLGGLKPNVSRQLLKIAKTGTIASPSAKAPTRLKPKIKLGSQLVREWNGRTHTVHVTDKGYVMSGVTYGSLSAAAKAITGAHWSGPRFFGVAG
ncbi:MAG: DUF2924 domain-containing protein [Litorimonas sp.]